MSVTRPSERDPCELCADGCPNVLLPQSPILESRGNTRKYGSDLG